MQVNRLPSTMGRGSAVPAVDVVAKGDAALGRDRGDIGQIDGHLDRQRHRLFGGFRLGGDRAVEEPLAELGRIFETDAAVRKMAVGLSETRPGGGVVPMESPSAERE